MKNLVIGCLRRSRRRLRNIVANAVDFVLSVFLSPGCKVEDFRFFSESDKKDLKWIEWSRVYEYEFALQVLYPYELVDSAKIHNTSWGFTDLHLAFKEELEKRVSNVVHSDFRKSNEANTTVFDIRGPVPNQWIDKFDLVMNISTLEEIEYSQILVLRNLLSMTKPGGKVLVTFDIPGFRLGTFERYLRRKIDVPISPVELIKEKVSGEKSLKVGLLLLLKS